MTYEWSYAGAVIPLLGWGCPLQAFAIESIYWIFPTLDHAFAEARKAGRVGTCRPHKHC